MTNLKYLSSEREKYSGMLHRDMTQIQILLPLFLLQTCKNSNVDAPHHPNKFSKSYIFLFTETQLLRLPSNAFSFRLIAAHIFFDMVEFVLAFSINHLAPELVVLYQQNLVRYGLRSLSVLLTNVFVCAIANTVCLF